MINAKMVKILGIVATAVGMGATLLTDWVNEKKMEEKIDERINEKNMSRFLRLDKQTGRVWR